MIGWDGSREAARAVHDALPFLDQSDAVFILSIASEATTESAADDRPTAVALASHLARDGLKAEAITQPARGASIAQLLEAAITELSIDLFVMGFYGHSRIGELILGGVTRESLRSVRVPVFGSH